MDLIRPIKELEDYTRTSKIGQTLKVTNDLTIVTKKASADNDCNKCVFLNNSMCMDLNCHYLARNDENHVYFEEVEQVNN